jgi:hypothetical protein
MELQFGTREGKFASVKTDGQIVRFTMGSVEKPLRAPFGISEPFDGSDSERRTLAVESEDPACVAKVREIDAAVLTAAKENCVAWLGKQLDDVSIGVMHTPLVKMNAKKEDMPPLLTTKVTLGKTEFFVAKPGKRTSSGAAATRVGTKDDLVANSKVMLKVSATSVMFGNKQFGVSLNVDAALIFPGATSGPSVFGDFEVDPTFDDDDK